MNQLGISIPDEELVDDNHYLSEVNLAIGYLLNSNWVKFGDTLRSTLNSTKDVYTRVVGNNRRLKGKGDMYTHANVITNHIVSLLLNKVVNIESDDTIDGYDVNNKNGNVVDIIEKITGDIKDLSDADLIIYIVNVMLTSEVAASTEQQVTDLEIKKTILVSALRLSVVSAGTEIKAPRTFEFKSLSYPSSVSNLQKKTKNKKKKGNPDLNVQDLGTLAKKVENMHRINNVEKNVGVTNDPALLSPNTRATAFAKRDVPNSEPRNWKIHTSSMRGLFNRHSNDGLSTQDAMKGRVVPGDTTLRNDQGPGPSRKRFDMDPITCEKCGQTIPDIPNEFNDNSKNSRLFDTENEGINNFGAAGAGRAAGASYEDMVNDGIDESQTRNEGIEEINNFLKDMKDTISQIHNELRTNPSSVRLRELQEILRGIQLTINNYAYSSRDQAVIAESIENEIAYLSGVINTQIRQLDPNNSDSDMDFGGGTRKRARKRTHRKPVHRKPVHRKRCKTVRKRKNKRKNKTRRDMPHKNKSKSTRRSRKRGGSRTHTPINSPELSRVAHVMNFVLSGLAIRYRDGWNWNAGTGGWLHLGNTDSVSDSPPFPDIILNVLNGNVEEARETLFELEHSDQGALPRTNVVNAILPISRVTPLMIAVYRRDVPMVRFLVENGADIGHTIEILSDNDYGTPVRTSVLDMARILNNDEYPDEIVMYLQSRRHTSDSE